MVPFDVDGAPFAGRLPERLVPFGLKGPVPGGGRPLRTLRLIPAVRLAIREHKPAVK